MRTLHIALFSICLLFANATSAQRLWLMDSDSALIHSSVVFDFTANAGWQSNSLEREMLDKLLFGGYIDAALIDRQANRTSDFLRLGGGYDANLRFWIMRDSALHSNDWGWQVQLQSRAHLDVAMPIDLFRIAFQGNSPNYLDRTANFDETWADLAIYQKFGLGLVHKPTQSGFVLSAVNGQQFERLHLTRGALYTSESGDSIAVMGNGTWLRSDTSTLGFGTGNGIGIALDGVLNLPLKASKGIVSIGVQDLGFVAWNDATQRAKIDTLWSFSGVNIAELINDSAQVWPQLDESLYSSNETGRRKRWLPGMVYTRLMHQVGTRDFIDVTLMFRPINAFIPQFSLGYHYRLPGSALVGVNATYGGYGAVRFGLSAEKWFGNSWFASLATDDIYGLIAQRGQGMHAGVRITYILKRNDTAPSSNG